MENPERSRHRENMRSVTQTVTRAEDWSCEAAILAAVPLLHRVFFFNRFFKRVSFVPFEIVPVIIHFLNIITTLACSSILLYMFRSGDWKSWQNFFLWFFFFQKPFVGFVLFWILQEIPLFSSSFFSFQNNGECKILHSITCPALKGEFITFWIKEKQCSKALDLSSRSLQFLDYLLD